MLTFALDQKIKCHLSNPLFFSHAQKNIKNENRQTKENVFQCINMCACDSLNKNHNYFLKCI